jgi:uncharacterized protein (DUF924 family)
VAGTLAAWQAAPESALALVLPLERGFPHRNAILGRPSTAAEIAFLADPNASL